MAISILLFMTDCYEYFGWLIYLLGVLLWKNKDYCFIWLLDGSFGN